MKLDNKVFQLVALVALSVIIVILTIEILGPSSDNVLAQVRRPNNFYFDVAVGNVLNHEPVTQAGMNDDVDTSEIEDIWDGGGVWDEPSTTQIYTITSSSSEDNNIAGIGARTIQIFGLDGDGDLVDEVIELNGTNSVTLTNQYQIIHTMRVLVAGSLGHNTGTISANATIDGTITAQINPLHNRTLMAIFRIPSGRRGCIISYFVGLRKEQGQTVVVDTFFRAKLPGQVYQELQVVGVIKEGTSHIEHVLVLPFCLPELTTIKVSAISSANNTGVTAGFNLITRP